jgi:hypothetical protein
MLLRVYLFRQCLAMHIESVIITVLKSITRKRLVKTEDFCMSCGYSDIWSMWFSGCGGDP